LPPAASLKTASNRQAEIRSSWIPNQWNGFQLWSRFISRFYGELPGFGLFFRSTHAEDSVTSECAAWLERVLTVCKPEHVSTLGRDNWGEAEKRQSVEPK
jgi:hypothetical protein